MNEEKVMQPGETILVSCGSYSDYVVCATVHVLKPVGEEVWSAMREAGKTTVTPNYAPHRPFTYIDSDKCLAWLLTEGYVMEIKTREFRIDSDWPDA